MCMCFYKFISKINNDIVIYIYDPHDTQKDLIQSPFVTLSYPQSIPIVYPTYTHVLQMEHLTYLAHVFLALSATWSLLPFAPLWVTSGERAIATADSLWPVLWIILICYKFMVRLMEVYM